MGLQTSRREWNCTFAPEHFSQLPFIHYSTQWWTCKKKKILLLPIMVILACLHTLPLVLSPPPDPVCVVHKWLPAPRCFASATFPRCCRITAGVRHRFSAPALCQRARHTRLAAKGRVSRSKHTPVYQSIQRRRRVPSTAGLQRLTKSPSKGLLLCQLCWTDVTTTAVTLFFPECSGTCCRHIYSKYTVMLLLLLLLLVVSLIVYITLTNTNSAFCPENVEWSLKKKQS